VCTVTAGDVDAQLHGCLLSMDHQTPVQVQALTTAHPLGNFVSDVVAANPGFSRRERNNSNSGSVNVPADTGAFRRQAMVSLYEYFYLA